MPNSQVTYTYDVDARIRCDSGYIKTVEGIMKLVLQLLCLGSLITASVTDLSETDEGSYYISVAAAALSNLGLLNSLYNFHFCEKFYKIPWLHIEVVIYTIYAVAYLVAAILTIREASKLTVASIFAFACLAVFIVEILRKSKAIKAGEIAQGTRTKVVQVV